MISAPADQECPVCRGSGWMRVDDGGAGAARPCGCRRRNLGAAALERAGIPSKYRECSFENFDTELPHDTRANLKRATMRCREYVSTYLSDSGSTERGLLFLGPPGVGKTHLAVATLRELTLLYGLRSRFLDFSSFIAEIQATFDPSSPESKHSLLDPVVHADLLLFDELGVQQPTPFVRDVLYLIVNGRYAARRPTLFTTNYRLKSTIAAESNDALNEPQPFDLSERRENPHQLLSERLSPMLYSRVLEMARVVPIDTADYRRLKLKGSVAR